MSDFRAFMVSEGIAKEVANYLIHNQIASFRLLAAAAGDDAGSDALMSLSGLDPKDSKVFPAVVKLRAACSSARLRAK